MNITTAHQQYKDLKNRCWQAGIQFNITLDQFINWYKDMNADINDASENYSRIWEMARKDRTRHFEIDNLEAKPKQTLKPLSKV